MENLLRLDGESPWLPNEIHMISENIEICAWDAIEREVKNTTWI
jgi:hypothetical protein